MIILKFLCERSKLLDVLLNVQRAVSTKSNLPALEGVYVRSHDSVIDLCGYNMDIAIKTTLPAEVLTPGEIVIGAKLFVEIVRKLPDEKVSISIKDNLTFHVESGSSAFDLAGIDAKEFPEIPQIDNSETIKIQSQVAKSMIRQTIFAVADTDSKPVHTGTLFDIKDNQITLVSVDGYRMALRREKIKENVQIKFVVPGKTLGDVLKLLPDSEEEMLKISMGQNHIIFNTGGYSIISRLLEGEFLDYNSAIPTSFKTKVRVNTRVMSESVERVSLLITDRLKSPVKCSFSAGQARLQCSTSIGKAVDEFSVALQGEDVEIGFNNKYMIDALRNSDTDEVSIEFSGPLSPIKIVPKEEEGFLFLVLPVRLR